MEKYRLAIDVGGTKIAYGIFNEENEIIFRHRTATPLEIMPDEFTEKLYTEIDEVLEKSGIPLSELKGISVGMPSYVDYENGMGISIGRLREDTVYDWKFVGLSHNTVRGAAGGAVLCAELLKAQGYITKK